MPTAPSPATCSSCRATMLEGAAPGCCTACLLALAGSGPRTASGAPADTLLDYVRIVNIIGESPRARVFLVKWTTPEGGLAALKCATSESISPDSVRRDRLADIDHPAIAAIFEMGRGDDARPYVLYEYVPGMPITRFCEARRLSLLERLQLWTEAVDALTYVHAMGIAHMNLKPSNLLVADASVKILDFEGVLGEPAARSPYAAPEQRLAAAADLRCDVYAMGMILDELCAGSADARLRAVITRATAQDPSERFLCLEDCLDAM